MNIRLSETSADPHHADRFPQSEYDRRVALVRRKMAELGVDALLVDAVEHMAYLFGYVPPAAIYQPAVLPLEGDPFVIVRALDAVTFTEQSWVREHVLFSDWDEPVEVLTDTLRAKGLGNAALAVEFDSHFMPVGRFRAIEARLPQARFVDFSRYIWEIRLVKSHYEIACLRKASEIADHALMACVNVAAAGVPERECAATLYAEALRVGADNGRSALMASGKRTDSLHGRLGNHVLEPGDIMHTESVPLYRGYGARIMRSTVIGEPDDELRDSARRLLAAQDRQFEAMKPGARGADVDAVLRKSVLAEGLRAAYDNFTGYTLGYIGLPKTSDFTRAFLPNSEWTLESGMVFHMYTYAKGLAFSETILVTDTGHERLTRLPRELFVR